LKDISNPKSGRELDKEELSKMTEREREAAKELASLKASKESGKRIRESAEKLREIQEEKKIVKEEIKRRKP
jgi:DnaJ-domain-containing protein 1